MSAKSNGDSSTKSRSLRGMFNCSKCPAYCCSYDRIQITKRDVLKIPRHFRISYHQAESHYTKTSRIGHVFGHKTYHFFQQVCQFLDTETRRCTIYDARPAVRREYPESRRCGYYDFLASERRRQDDPEFIPSA